MKQVTVTLPDSVWEYLGNLLAERPYKESFQVIKMIADQVAPQLNPQPQPPAAPPRPAGAETTLPSALQ